MRTLHHQDGRYRLGHHFSLSGVRLCHLVDGREKMVAGSGNAHSSDYAICPQTCGMVMYVVSDVDAR